MDMYMEKNQREMIRFLYLLKNTPLRNFDSGDRGNGIILTAFNIFSVAQQYGLNWPDLELSRLKEIKESVVGANFAFYRETDSVVMLALAESGLNRKHIDKVLKAFEDEWPKETKAIKHAITKYKNSRI